MWLVWMGTRNEVSISVTIMLFIRQFQRFFFHPRENFLIVVGEGDEVHSSLLIQDHTSRIVQSHHLNTICGLVICVSYHTLGSLCYMALPSLCTF